MQIYFVSFELYLLCSLVWTVTCFLWTSFPSWEWECYMQYNES